MSDRRESEFFADGISEEIINALTRIPELKVTSRTSSFFYKGKSIPIPRIGQELGVALILEGSIRFGGNKVRITAQLIQAEDDFHFFSETWDRELNDIFLVQDEISMLIADKIREHTGHFELKDQLVAPQTENITAYEYSLKANFYKNKWNAEDAKLAEEYYQKSLELDSSYVESIIGLADVYSFLGMIGAMPFQESWVKCNNLIDKTLLLDPTNAKAFYQKGHSAFFTEVNFSKALEYGTKAIKRNPNYAEAQQFMSFIYVLSGKTEEAKNHLDIAIGLDPLNQETLFFKAYFDYMTRNYTAALDQLSACIQVNPANIPAHAVMTLCLLKLGDYDKVIHYFDDFEEEFVEAEKTGAIALAYALKKDKENTKKYLNILLEQAKSPDGFAFDSYVFMIYAVTGEIDKAFEWVENGIKNKASLLMLRFTDPMVDELRADERYEKLHDRIYQTDIKASSESGKKALMDETTAAEYKEKLMEHVVQNEAFLDANLTLRSLANQIDLHPNKLSWLINELHEQNFNQFINNYRIEHFKKLAVNPDNSQFSILGLAYESGFNSKTVFNTYFKKATGQTPKAWINTQ
jgi:TolB-like protein/AraC-like DNA-binding protein/Tfp pilus assembly protein PilF